MRQDMKDSVGEDVGKDVGGWGLKRGYWVGSLWVGAKLVMCYK